MRPAHRLVAATASLAGAAVLFASPAIAARPGSPGAQVSDPRLSGPGVDISVTIPTGWHQIGADHQMPLREEPVEVIRSAARSVIEWYLDTTVRFDKALSSRPRVGPRYEALDACAMAGPTRTEALSWLEHQRANLVEAVLLAERHELDDLAWQLCEALWGVFHLHGHYEDWIIMHRAGLACAVHSGDRRAEMRMSAQLGAGLLATGDLAEAEISFAGSLAAAREVADALGEQSALEWLGKVAARRGDLELALSYLDHSQRVAESSVDTGALPRTLAILALQRGRFLAVSGRLPQALDELAHAADYFDTTTEADTQAKVALETGRVLQAMDPGRRRCRAVAAGSGWVSRRRLVSRGSRDAGGVDLLRRGQR